MDAPDQEDPDVEQKALDDFLLLQFRHAFGPEDTISLVVEALRLKISSYAELRQQLQDALCTLKPAPWGCWVRACDTNQAPAAVSTRHRSTIDSILQPSTDTVCQLFQTHMCQRPNMRWQCFRPSHERVQGSGPSEWRVNSNVYYELLALTGRMTFALACRKAKLGLVIADRTLHVLRQMADAGFDNIQQPTAASSSQPPAAGANSTTAQRDSTDTTSVANVATSQIASNGQISDAMDADAPLTDESKLARHMDVVFPGGTHDATWDKLCVDDIARMDRIAPAMALSRITTALSHLQPTMFGCWIAKRGRNAPHRQMTAWSHVKNVEILQAAAQQVRAGPDTFGYMEPESDDDNVRTKSKPLTPSEKALSDSGNWLVCHHRVCELFCVDPADSNLRLGCARITHARLGTDGENGLDVRRRRKWQYRGSALAVLRLLERIIWWVTRVPPDRAAARMRLIEERFQQQCAALPFASVRTSVDEKDVKLTAMTDRMEDSTAALKDTPTNATSTRIIRDASPARHRRATQQTAKSATKGDDAAVHDMTAIGIMASEQHTTILANILEQYETLQTLRKELRSRSAAVKRWNENHPDRILTSDHIRKCIEPIGLFRDTHTTDVLQQQFNEYIRKKNTFAFGPFIAMLESYRPPKRAAYDSTESGVVQRVTRSAPPVVMPAAAVTMDIDHDATVTAGTTTDSARTAAASPIASPGELARQCYMAIRTQLEGLTMRQWTRELLDKLSTDLASHTLHLPETDGFRLIHAVRGALRNWNQLQTQLRDVCKSLIKDMRAHPSTTSSEPSSTDEATPAAMNDKEENDPTEPPAKRVCAPCLQGVAFTLPLYIQKEMRGIDSVLDTILTKKLKTEADVKDTFNHVIDTLGDMPYQPFQRVCDNVMKGCLTE